MNNIFLYRRRFFFPLLDFRYFFECPPNFPYDRLLYPNITPDHYSFPNGCSELRLEPNHRENMHMIGLELRRESI